MHAARRPHDDALGARVQRDDGAGQARRRAVTESRTRGRACHRKPRPQLVAAAPCGRVALGARQAVAMDPRRPRLRRPLVRLRRRDASASRGSHDSSISVPRNHGALGRRLFGEAISRRIIAATAASLAGVLLVARPTLLFDGVAPPLDPFWVGVAMCGAACSAAAYVVVRKLSQSGEDPLVIVFYFPLITIPLALPTMLPNFVWPEGTEWLLLLGIGVATQVGQVSLTRGLAVLPAAQGTAFSYLQVAFAIIWGAVVFGEIPDALALAGGALVVGSAFWLARSKPAAS